VKSHIYTRTVGYEYFFLVGGMRELRFNFLHDFRSPGVRECVKNVKIICNLNSFN